MQRLVVWRTPFLVLSASVALRTFLRPRLLCVAGAERKLLPMGHMTAVTSEPVCTDKTRALTIGPSCTDKTTQKLQSLSLADLKRLFPATPEQFLEQRVDLKDLPYLDSSVATGKAVGDILSADTPSGHPAVPLEQRLPLVAQRVELPWAPDATCFTIEGLLSDDECEQLVALSESRGYEPAGGSDGGRSAPSNSVRRSGRWCVDSGVAAEELWRRLEPLVPDVQRRVGHERAMGLNERLRLLRYSRGDHFAPHQDATYRTDAGQLSRMTVLVYLNTPDRGGQTRFHDPQADGHGQAVDVSPRKGLGLVFEHRLLHKGAELEAGVKYALRTDVMFERRGADQ